MGRRFRSVLAYFLFLVALVPGSWGQEAPAGVGQVFDALAAEHGGAPPAMVRLITTNPEAWYARWHMIDGAKKTIDTTYYIVDDDIFGRAFLGLLFKKAKEGVQIRLMIDSRGSKGFARTWVGQDFLQEMTEYPNVQIRIYNPVHTALLRLPEDIRSAVASDHQKLLIVDGEWFITGGRNISHTYMADRTEDEEAFRDCDVLIQGGAAPAQAKVAFEEEWEKPANAHIQPDRLGNWVSRNLDLELARRVMQAHMMGLDPVSGVTDGTLAKKLAVLQEEVAPYQGDRAYAAFRPFQGERSYPVLLLGKHSLYHNERNDITPNLQKLFDAAQTEILIQNPYVVLTDGAKAALKRASDRGVKISIWTNSPESSDVALTQALFLREWKGLLKDIPNLRIFAVDGHNKLHAKVFVFDRKVSVVGSYNMDSLSEEVNAEDVAVINCPGFSEMCAHRVEHDMHESVEYKIRVAADGSVEQVTGPSDHVQKKVLDLVERWSWLAFLRPLI